MFDGWKAGFICAIGLRVQHDRLLEDIGQKALGEGALFGLLVGEITPGVTIVTGRADQTIQILNKSVNPMRSERASHGNVQTPISPTIGYMLWGMRAGITGI